jgi:hypothetical protein
VIHFDGTRFYTVIKGFLPVSLTQCYSSYARSIQMVRGTIGLDNFPVGATFVPVAAHWHNIGHGD